MENRDKGQVDNWVIKRLIYEHKDIWISFTDNVGDIEISKAGDWHDSIWILARVIHRAWIGMDEEKAIDRETIIHKVLV